MLILGFIPSGSPVGSELKHDVSGVTSSSSRPLNQLQVEPSAINVVITNYLNHICLINLVLVLINWYGLCFDNKFTDKSNH